MVRVDLQVDASGLIVARERERDAQVDCTSGTRAPSHEPSATSSNNNSSARTLVNSALESLELCGTGGAVDGTNECVVTVVKERVK